ncbi:hypothetical protein E3P81_03001 [Wallemia ichthyophaga]|nr:hypothetical protein E3P97_03135 [Wallemia ichthyophaga]TIB10994.1 hypothetical protein E3P93_02738 [Wallemia ichthyophaga]TIB30231.1 hypothetical protein E3P85_02830 [Wallemia ichthyophaga]TIB45177.1 hypothetical protein E3P82_03061 [Wallemia ichthyophaga]TIB48151.1 hypothetical protein E3P81_03001 [Wallemia ichthyophaga]
MLEGYTLRLKHLFTPTPKLDKQESNPHDILMTGGSNKEDTYHEIPIASISDTKMSVITIIIRSCQMGSSLLCLIMWAATAGFQAKWEVGPSGLSGSQLTFADNVDCFIHDTNALREEEYAQDLFLKERRSAWVLNGAGVLISLLLAAITTGSAFTTPGCENPDDDPHEGKGDDFKNALSTFCGTKKAAAILFWIVFFSWMGSIAEIMLNSKTLIKKGRKSGVRDPPFTAPDMDEEAAAGGYGYSKETYQPNTSRPYDDSSEPLTSGQTINPFEPEPGNPYDRVSMEENHKDPFSHPQMPEPGFVYRPGMYSDGYQ